MSIALRGAVQSDFNNYPVTLSKPAGVVTNDVLIGVQWVQNTWDVATTPPTGFSNGERIGDVVNGAAYRLAAWVHLCNGSEPSSVDFTNDSGFRANQGAFLLAFSGCDVSTMTEAFASFADDANDSSVAVPSITSTVDGSLRIIVNVVDEETVVTDPAGSTQLGNYDDTAHTIINTIWSVPAPTAGSQGGLTIGYSGRDFAQLGIQFILRALASNPPVGTQGEFDPEMNIKGWF